MKSLPEAFVSFTRTERNGLIALTTLLLLLFVTRLTLPLWVKPPEDDLAANQKLAADWDKFRSEHAVNPAPGYASNRVADVPVKLFFFDPNTLDSAGFLQLGLAPRVVKGLMNWRRHGKQFHKKEDLKPLYNLTPEMYARLEPYISIPPHEEHTDRYRQGFESHFQKEDPLPAIIDLNTTDSAILVRLNGIGPTLAHKIVARRTALGGFLRHEQLMEVYHFPDTVFAMLQHRLLIRPEGVHRMNLNTVTAEQLLAHPYIGEKTARNIILYREGLKHYDDVKQLRQVPLMNEEIYRKIAPYLTTE